MTVKVVGAGFGRTGTLSLKYALEMLGFTKCYHMMEVHQTPEHVAIWRQAARGEPVDWSQVFAGYQASVDWPSCNFWREQLQAFPDAKVLLSKRDPEKWYESVMNTIWKASNDRRNSDDSRAQAGSAMAFEVIWDGVFAGRMDDKDHVIGIYNAHNRRVIDEVPADKLLVFEARQGWAPICEFLDCPVPTEDYPRVNTTEGFTERWQKIAAEAASKKA